MEKSEMKEKWLEVFSQGDVWELEAVGGFLYGLLTGNDSFDYGEGEVADNGISNVRERARMMGLEFTELFY